MGMFFTYRTNVLHGIKFKVGTTTKDTWKDWKIVPTSRPVINPPAAVVNMTMLPGATEPLDTSESVSGRPSYGLRTGQWEFQVINKTLWIEVYSEIMNFLQGKSVQVILNDEPAYYYVGRCQVNQWVSDQTASRIAIDYTLYPYKYYVQDSSEAWKWDPFSFVDGVIRSSYSNIAVDGTASLTVKGTDMPVSPTYNVTLTNSTPSLTWSQGGIAIDGSEHDSGDDLYNYRARTGLFTGRCYVTPSSGYQTAVAVYDSEGTYLGYMNSSGAVSTSAATWFSSRFYTPVSDNQYRLITRVTGGSTTITAATARTNTTVKACMTVRAGSGTNYPLVAGSNISVPDIIILSGTTTLNFIGTGTVTVKYRGGKL